MKYFGKGIPLCLKADIFGDTCQNKTAPLILIHGLFGSKQNWRSIARSLQQKLGNRIYAIDLRNHGESPHHDSHRYSDMASDVLNFVRTTVLEDHQHSSIFLLGHSMGGKVAAEVALNTDGGLLIEKLIIEDISLHRKVIGGSRGPYAKYIKAMLSANLQLSKQDIDRQLASTITNDQIRNFLLTNIVTIRNNNHVDRRWRCNLEAIKNALDHLFAHQVFDPSDLTSTKFDKPTLFINGENSDYLNLAREESILRKVFEQPKFVTISNAGHWVHAEQPYAFIDAIVEFLS